MGCPARPSPRLVKPFEVGHFGAAKSLLTLCQLKDFACRKLLGILRIQELGNGGRRPFAHADSIDK